MAEFKEAQHAVHHMRAVDDAAERAIKLITDYTTKITKHKDEKQVIRRRIEAIIPL